MIRDDLPRVMVDGVRIPYAESVVYLGVTLTSILSWDEHVTRTVSRVNSSLYQLKIYKNLLSTELRTRLVSTLLIPYFDYCCTLLTNISGDGNLRLQRAMNNCVQFIFNVKWFEHITPFLHNLKWLRIASRRSYFIGCLIYKLLKSGRPLVNNIFAFRRVDSSRCTRAIDDTLVLPQSRTEMFRRSFRCVAVDTWNAIPVDIRNEPYATFQSRLYNHLLNNELH